MGRAPGARKAPAPGEPIVPDGGFDGDLAGQALPFLHRYMLNYGQESTFELQIRTQSTTNLRLQISGGTRSALINHKLNAGTAGDVATATIRIDDFPIFLAVSDNDGTEVQGHTFVTVNLLINGELVANLLSGYVYAGKPLSWPAHNSKDLIPNRGEISIVVGANPVAGAEATLTLDDNEIWLVHWASIRLVTDANAGNRRVHLVFTPDTAGLLHFFSDANQIESTTRDYTFSQQGDISDREDDTRLLVSIPNNLWLEPGTVITTDTTNIKAGDDFTAIVIMREKFYVGN